MYKRIVFKTCFLLAVCVFIFTCLVKVKRAEGNTMSPFVRDGDLCIFLRTEKVTAGEVVIYKDRKGKDRIGRIAGIGGQTIDFPENGGYTLDGYQPSEEIPYETYQAEHFENADGDGDSGVRYPLELKEGELFILNDFRSLTDDSRIAGPVKKDSIKGKLFFLLRRRGF